MVEHVPSAQGMIPGSWDQVPHRALWVEPASPSACVSASLSVSHEYVNKIVKKKFKKTSEGHLSGSMVGRLPLAQGTTLGSQDGVPHRAPWVEPASPSACVSASLPMSLMNKQIRPFKK